MKKEQKEQKERMKTKLYVSIVEFDAIKTWSYELERDQISELQFYKKIRSLLGRRRCPRPFTGPHELVVEEFEKFK